jgi:hypothetical protein
LPLIVDVPGEAGAGGLGHIVDEVAAGVAVDALDGDIRRATIDAGNAAIRGAIVLVALVLHQPVQGVGDLPVDGGGQQGALAGHVVAKALLVLLGQVQAHLYPLSRLAVEVGGEASAVEAAGLGADAGGLPFWGTLLTRLTMPPCCHGRRARRRGP